MRAETGMVVCRCCRQAWAPDSFRVLHGRLRGKCKACEKHGPGSAAYRARLWRAARRAGLAPVVWHDRVVLGPCPCQGCGLSLVWNGWGWSEASGDRHRCTSGDMAVVR